MNPKKEHGEAIRWLARYLMGTRDKGIIIKPEKGRNLEMYVDAFIASSLQISGKPPYSLAVLFLGVHCDPRTLESSNGSGSEK